MHQAQNRAREEETINRQLIKEKQQLEEEVTSLKSLERMQDLSPNSLAAVPSYPGDLSRAKEIIISFLGPSAVTLSSANSVFLSQLHPLEQELKLQMDKLNRLRDLLNSVDHEINNLKSTNTTNSTSKPILKKTKTFSNPLISELFLPTAQRRRSFEPFSSFESSSRLRRLSGGKDSVLIPALRSVFSHSLLSQPLSSSSSSSLSSPISTREIPKSKSKNNLTTTKKKKKERCPFDPRPGFTPIQDRFDFHLTMNDADGLERDLRAFEKSISKTQNPKYKKKLQKQYEMAQKEFYYYHNPLRRKRYDPSDFDPIEVDD